MTAKMTANESRLPLLSDDQMEVWDLGEIDSLKTTQWNSDTEGSSSGYGSSLNDSDSDDDSVCSDYSCDDSSDDEDFESESEDDEKESSVNESTEVMNYRSTHALCNQLKYILSVPELCDVTFVVGPDKTQIHGVKAIMATRSRVFHSLILKSQREREELSVKKSKFSKKKKRINQRLIIEVTKYEPEVFRMIIQFVHCGTVEVDIQSVIGVLCGAVQFGLEDLETACWDFVDRCLNSTAINKLTQSLQHYKQHQSSKDVLSKVHQYLEVKNRSTTNKRETAV